MQQQNKTFTDFSERTDRLAASLSVNLEEIPGKLGMSRAMFFAYRSGKSPISTKAWAKLENAEREIGMPASGKSPPAISGEMPRLHTGESPKEIAGFLRSEAKRLRDRADRFTQAADLLDPPDSP